MNLPQVDKKYLAVAIALLFVAVAVIVYLPPAFTSKTINAYFSQSTLSPGQNTDLIVEITNTLDRDIPENEFSMSVSSINEGITIGEFAQPTGTIGKGDMRKITVPIALSGDLLGGTYSLEIMVNFGEEAHSSRVVLTITK
jgi:hypothetical protein